MVAPVIKEGCTSGGRCAVCDVELARKRLSPGDAMIPIYDGLCNLRADQAGRIYSQQKNAGMSQAPPPPQSA